MIPLLLRDFFSAESVVISGSEESTGGVKIFETLRKFCGPENVLAYQLLPSSSVSDSDSSATDVRVAL